MKKILIIEDEKNLIDIIADTLSEEGFHIIKAFNGDDGLQEFYDQKPDLVLLDINLPKKNGWNICSEIRKYSNIPIIMMTARDTEFDELKGLELGADDYITKPFSLKILSARIKKILKLENNSIYRYKTLTFDFKRHLLTIDEETIELSKKEAQLLEYFIKNRNMVLTREMLLNEIWGLDMYIEDRTVDTLIKRIRKKLNIYSDHIKTIRGVGYSFDEN